MIIRMPAATREIRRCIFVYSGREAPGRRQHGQGRAEEPPREAVAFAGIVSRTCLRNGAHVQPQANVSGDQKRPELVHARHYELRAERDGNVGPAPEQHLYRPW